MTSFGIGTLRGGLLMLSLPILARNASARRRRAGADADDGGTRW